MLPSVTEALEAFATNPVRLKQAIGAIAEGYKGPISAAWKFGLHSDAIEAIQNATQAELEELAQALSGAQRSDAQEILLAQTEYEYGDDGELSLTRELDAHGNVVNEWE